MKASSIFYAIGCGCLIICAQAFAGSDKAARQSNPLEKYTLFGVDGATGLLYRHQFSKNITEPVDYVHVDGVGVITGIRGTAHITDHLNIIGFWNDEAAKETKLIYINTDTAKASVVGRSVGSGPVTAATVAGVVAETGDIEGRVEEIVGGCNLNPNNSTDGMFVLMDVDMSANNRSSHTRIDRNTLHSDNGLNALINNNKKTRYCTDVWMQPKGNGNKNTLTFGGESFELKNGHLYHFSCEFKDGAPVPMPYTLTKDHDNPNAKAMGHWWLNFEKSARGTIVDLTDGGVFALQTIEAHEEEPVMFSVKDGEVVADGDVAVKITVLGASPGRGVYETVASTIAGDTYTPFGSLNDPSDGNVNDVNNPRHHIAPRIFPAGTAISLKARSFLGVRGGGFSDHISVDSSTDSRHVLMLRNGDKVPNKKELTDPKRIRDFLRDFVDQKSGRVVVDENQVLCLFELTTDDFSRSIADFDDLAVLITFAKDPADLTEDDDDDSIAGPASRLVKVNRHTGGFDQVMTLDRVYSAVTATSNGMFYATIDNQIYKIDPFNQTETLVTTTPYGDVTAMEPADTAHFGFSTSASRLFQVDVLTGNQIGSALDLGVSDLQSIVLVKNPPVGYEAFD